MAGRDLEQQRTYKETEALLLDNSFPHYVYNHSDEDRFVLIVEVWHPALTAVERDALATIFALNDRMTVLALSMAPFGFSDPAIEAAIESGEVADPRFWTDLAYGVE